ncbi:odorant receptor 85b-like [Chironomus tepperi]|uniref:odorant receptor 85b-like n=1 Tax=Chironomus tepperi TaxID=113505 RepID=UPI00391F4D25
MQNAIERLENILKRKLGRNKSTLTYIKFQDFLCYEESARILGFSFLRRPGSLPAKWMKLNNILFHLMLMAYMTLESISFVLSAKKKLMYIMIENVLLCGLQSIALFKMHVVLAYKRKTIAEVLEKLDEHFPHSGVDQMNFKLHKYLRTLKIFKVLYYTTFTIIDLSLSLMPIFHKIYGTIYSIAIEWELIVTLELPFDQQQSIIYGTMYSIEIWLVIFCAFYVISTDMLFACLIQILALEFDILGQIMSKIDVAEGEEKAIKEFKRLIDIHQQLIEVSEKLDDTFAPLQLINAFGSITALCTASFLAVSGISDYFIAKYFMFPICCSLQIFTQCYFAQRLIDSSESVSEAAYSIEWYSCSVKFRRLVLQVMMRAQKAQTITAFKFFDMSLEIFKWLEIMSLMDSVPKEYYITNKHSKFNYNFNRPKFIHLTPDGLTPEAVDEIRSSKFGVVIQYSHEFENEDEETQMEFGYRDSCPVNKCINESPDYNTIGSLLKEFYDNL